MRIGIVGLGFGSYGLIPAFRRDPRAEIVALCGRSERAAAIAAKWGVAESFVDVEAMLDRVDLDAIAVATPPEAIIPIADAAIARGLHVFAEKPLGLTFEAARGLAARAEAAGIANVVDFQFPEIIAWAKAKEALDQGGVTGGLRHVTVHWAFESHDNARGLEGWKTDAGGGGGALSHFGSHALHAVEWFLGPLASLSAGLHQAPASGRPGDTHAVLDLCCRSGVSCSIVLSSAALFGTRHRWEFFGEDGTLVLDNTSTSPVCFQLLSGRRGDTGIAKVALPSDATGPIGAGPEDPRVAPCSRLVRRFLDWAEFGSVTGPTFADGARVQKLIALARQSAAQGCRFDVSPGLS